MFSEGQLIKNFYLIKDGEFEITKKVYITKNIDTQTKEWKFLRYYSSKNSEWIEKLFNLENQILFTNDKNALGKEKYTKKDSSLNWKTQVSSSILYLATSLDSSCY